MCVSNCFVIINKEGVQCNVSKSKLEMKICFRINYISTNESLSTTESVFFRFMILPQAREDLLNSILNI